MAHPSRPVVGGRAVVRPGLDAVRRRVAAGSATRRTSPGLATMAAAARWLDEEAAAHDRFFLFVDEFDPHEPFDTPEPWASRYDERWDGPHLIWPPYTDGAIAQGRARATTRPARSAPSTAPSSP